MGYLFRVFLDFMYPMQIVSLGYESPFLWKPVCGWIYPFLLVYKLSWLDLGIVWRLVHELFCWF
jgi:hypothetical protein